MILDLKRLHDDISELKGAIFLDFDQICIQHMQQANKNSLECRQIEFA